jgi:putative addiction module component (TIGR02574 family)
MTIEQLKEQVDALSPEDRAELTRYLLCSHDPENDDEQAVEAAWDVVLQRRLAEIESGKAVGVPAEEVLARLRKKYP